MKMLSPDTATYIANLLCSRRRDLKSSAAYWNSKEADSKVSEEELAHNREIYRTQLELNAAAVKDVSEVLAPWLQQYPNVYREVADVFEQTKAKAPDQGDTQ